MAAWCKDLYRARLGDEGALAVYRGAHRPRVRGGRNEGGEEEEEAEGEDPEDPATEPEGDAVFEGPVAPPHLDIHAIFDMPQEEDEEQEEENEDVDSQQAFGSQLVAAPSIASLEADSQPSSEHIIEVPNSPGECSNMVHMMIVVFACCQF